MKSKVEQWYYSDGEKVIGPLPEKAIRNLIANGNIKPSFFLTPTDATDWKPVTECFHDSKSSSEAKTIASPHEKETNLDNDATKPPPPRFFGIISDHLTSAAGIERLEGFSFKELFSEVFSNHSLEEVEEEFAAGTRRTTPSVTEIYIGWPKPWIFLRMIGISLAVYFVILEVYKQTQNVNFIPAIIFTGAFAIPISTLVFFFEVNIRRNISLFRVLLLFLIGGLASLAIAMPLFGIAESMGLYVLNSSVAGPVEETAKILAVFIFARSQRFHYVQNGLLFGAAVGTGFAAFETAGYALRALTGEFQGTTVIAMLQIRGPLSPLGHIVWTAIATAALWSAKGNEALRFEHFFQWKFLRVFAISIALHMIWNSSYTIPFLPTYSKYILLGAIAWIIAIGFVQAGVHQVRDEALGHPNKNI